jgi:hypothetical protein
MIFCIVNLTDIKLNLVVSQKVGMEWEALYVLGGHVYALRAHFFIYETEQYKRISEEDDIGMVYNYRYFVVINNDIVFIPQNLVVRENTSKPIRCFCAVKP